MILKIRRHSYPYQGIFINGVQLDKELRSVKNTNPTVKDIELCVKHRGMAKEAIAAAETIFREIDQRIKAGEEDFTFTINV